MWVATGHKEQFYLDSKDDAVRMSTVLLDGELKWPPPPLPTPPPPPPKPEAAPEETGPPDLYKPTLNSALVTTGGVAGIIGMGFVSPSVPPPPIRAFDQTPAVALPSTDRVPRRHRCTPNGGLPGAFI